MGWGTDASRRPGGPMESVTPSPLHRSRAEQEAAWRNRGTVALKELSRAEGLLRECLPYIHPANRDLMDRVQEFLEK